MGEKKETASLLERRLVIRRDDGMRDRIVLQLGVWTLGTDGLVQIPVPSLTG